MIALVFCLSAMLGLLVASSSYGTVTAVRERPTGMDATSVRTLALTAHDPISITGNAGFTNASGVVWGSGTESDPYIIEGWDISASTWFGIYMLNTDAHFIVRTCYVHDGISNYYTGIMLWNCANGTLDSNTCSNNQNGILLGPSSNNNTVSNNTCSSNDPRGIILYPSSNNNTLSNNTCSNNWDGITVMGSDNTLSNNTCSNNYYGIISSSTTTLSNNICSSNNGYGIYLSSSSGSTLGNNTLMNNSGYGLYIGSPDSSSNRIWNNTFIGNNGATETYDATHIQAYDDGTNNWWNSTDGYGNYWSDWTTPDVAPPHGIVDVQYDIAGSAGAKDYHPLTTTPTEPIPEFAMIPLVLVILLASIVLTIGARRRKAQ